MSSSAATHEAACRNQTRPLPCWLEESAEHSLLLLSSEERIPQQLGFICVSVQAGQMNDCDSGFGHGSAEGYGSGASLDF